jgi:hypothetical protein
VSQDLGQEDIVGLVFGLEEVAAAFVSLKLHTVNPYIPCMYVCIFEVLDQEREGVGVGPSLPRLWPGPSPWVLLA